MTSEGLLISMTAFEERAIEEGFSVIAGIDEAGRGPLAGPVVACACLYTPHLCVEGVNDSKKLTAKQRQKHFHYFQSHPEISFALGSVDPQTIDEINIYQATKQAMYQAVEALSQRPEILLVDGMELPYPNTPSERIVKGDSRSITIAAASILAKETRDAWMLEFHERWPQYGFAKHKGYPTKEHLHALRTYGPCPIHRRSYQPVREVLSINSTLVSND